MFIYKTTFKKYPIHSRLSWSSFHTGIRIHTHAHVLVKIPCACEIHGGSVYSFQMNVPFEHIPLTHTRCCSRDVWMDVWGRDGARALGGQQLSVQWWRQTGRWKCVGFALSYGNPGDRSAWNLVWRACQWQRCPNQDTESHIGIFYIDKKRGATQGEGANVHKGTKKCKNAVCLGKSKLCSVISCVCSWFRKRQNLCSW